ncbi:hypothetical protein A9X05_21360 [Mycobacterium sp. E3298]|uniref:hypothetical protein n=1 Tax=unclassified Mycobacterium TaxID=2642494 RepID=UPI0007FED851|nr:MULTISPECIES: hypothetical protein [unclassified Mycobacterium]OBG79044.1 hypothetical protein A5701_14940 [Mycobacterium sp. E3305]OBG79899.1 hypothetical protein A9X05_21360 [Mycobacterium sp. E3298]
MTTEQPTTEVTPADEQTVEQPDQAAADDEHSTETDSGSANREAAKWRVKLRETEQQRDALAAQLDVMRRQQVGAIVTSMGLKEAAVWAAGTQVGDLLDDSGAVDTAKVRQAVEAARNTLGIAKPSRPVGGFKSGVLQSQPPRNDWRAAFAPKRE